MPQNDQSAEMDVAASEAKEELDVVVEAMSPAEREGVRLIIVWLVKWTMKAGYKRLCRLLKAL